MARFLGRKPRLVGGGVAGVQVGVARHGGHDPHTYDYDSGDKLQTVKIGWATGGTTPKWAGFSPAIPQRMEGIGTPTATTIP